MSLVHTPEQRLDLIRKWFRAEAIGPCHDAPHASAWYLDFETAERVGKAYVAERNWDRFDMHAVYSVEEPPQ